MRGHIHPPPDQGLTVWTTLGTHLVRYDPAPPGVFEPLPVPVQYRPLPVHTVSVGRDQTAVGWWEWMVVRFVCVIRVPVTVPCVSRLPRCLFTGTYETTSLPVYR